MDELKNSLKDIPALTHLLEDDDIWNQVVNDMSRRRRKDDADSINFYEWLFVRSVAVAWTVASGQKDSITRDELLDIGLKVMPHFSSYEGQLKQAIFAAIDFKDFYTSYDFVETVNVLHIFSVFESMRKHSSTVGVLSFNHFLRAIEDG